MRIVDEPILKPFALSLYLELQVRMTQSVLSNNSQSIFFYSRNTIMFKCSNLSKIWPVSMSLNSVFQSGNLSPVFFSVLLNLVSVLSFPVPSKSCLALFILQSRLMRGHHAWLSMNTLSLLKLFRCSQISLASFTNPSMCPVLLASMVSSQKSVYGWFLSNVPWTRTSLVVGVTCGIHVLCIWLL
jgi:hypothetical protein